MAAQARSYEKNISYSSRQVDDKYLQKNHHRGNAPSSRDSSPYRSKSNNHHSSPNGRKRPYDSPSSVSSKHSSNSPYETSRKKDRGMNNFVKSSNPGQIESDWSQHVSSSGKIYYYNKRTEESQWEVPKDWMERQKDSKDIQRTNSLLKDTQISSTSFNTKNLPQNDRLIRDIQDSKCYKLPHDKNTFARDYREQDSKTYKDFRNNRDNHKSESWNNRDRDRDYRNNRDSRDYYDAKYRSSSGSSSKRDSRYDSSSVKTLGQSTPFSSTTSVNRTYRGTPDQLNGFDIVQDISPPGTPTSDDIMNLSNISPAPIYTPHGCSPLLNTSNSIITIPTTPCTPLLSPVVLNVGGNIVGQLPTPFLHPLQQALLLQQQQVTSTNKDIYGSPKLPTVKNHLADSGSASSSPRLSSSSFHQRSNSHSSPLHSSRSNSNSTPPPPPPPLKGQLSENRDVGRSAKVDRYHRNVDSRMEHYTSTRDSLNRSKSYDNRNDDTPLKPKSSEVRYNADRSAKKQKCDCDFPELPNIDQYFSSYAHSLGDFSTGFYGSVFEKQASTAWDETMCLLHADGYQTKHKLYMSKHGSNLHESKFDVAANWSGALHTVLLKVESLQDSSLASSEVRSRDYKSSPISRKQKYDTNMESNGTDNANKTKIDVNQETVEIVGDKLQPSSDTKLPR